jgi:hypothetical protein
MTTTPGTMRAPVTLASLAPGRLGVTAPDFMITKGF